MDFNLDWVSLLTGAFGIGILKVIWDASSFFIKRYDEKKMHSDEMKLKSKALELTVEDNMDMEELFDDLFMSGVKIHDVITNFAREYDIARVTVKKIQNGGGIPQLGTPQYVTVTNEFVHCADMKSIKKDYQKLELTPEYIKLLKLCLIDNSESPTILSSSIIEDLQLSALFHSNHTKSFCKFKIISMKSLESDRSYNNGFMMYLSCEFRDERKMDDKLLTAFFSVRNEIKLIYEEFYMRQMTKLLKSN